ncbi:chitinase, acidic.1 [Aplochiton taeniatus]
MFPLFSTALGLLMVLQLAASSTKLVCHVTNWAQYRPSSAKFTTDNVDPFLCTHVVYSLATINSFNNLITVEWNDEDQFKVLNNLKNVNPTLKTLLSVGGTINGISPFISMVSKPESRDVFIKSVISFLRLHNFDGVNLVWEFPGHNGSPATDKQRFTDLVKELDQAFVDEANDTRKTQLLLSASVSSYVPTIDVAYEVPEISSHLDFISVMTYDYHGSWEATTGHNSPLYRSKVDSVSQQHHNIDSSISHWMTRGAPSEKLLMTFPTFGRTYRLSTGTNGLGAPANGPADAGPYTRTAGFWAYYEVCSFIPGATVQWIDEQMVPYATHASSWVGYDNRESYAAKAQWMNANNLGGASVWTLDMDDFQGAFCAEGAYPLVEHLRTIMGFAPKPTTTPRPTTTRNPITSFCEGRPDGLYPNPADASTYFQCFRGNTYLYSCQPGLVYVDACKCCNYP